MSTMFRTETQMDLGKSPGELSRHARTILRHSSWLMLVASPFLLMLALLTSESPLDVFFVVAFFYAWAAECILVLYKTSTDPHFPDFEKLFFKDKIGVKENTGGQSEDTERRQK